jgi:hypothetical protein
MAVVLLVTAVTAEPVMGPEVAERLRAVGVTRVELFRDREFTGVVLGGWAFDPTRADEATRAIFPGQDPSVRTLHEVVRVAVSDAPSARRTA